VTGSEATKKITSFASNSEGLAGGIFRSAWKFLSFSPAHKAISYSNSMAVSLAKGRISVVSGSRFLSRISIRHAKEFMFDLTSFPDPETLASTVALSADEFGLKNATLVFTVPKTWTVFAIREFPATIMENISDAIGYELDRMTPFKADEALFDFRIVGRKAGKITVLTAAAKADAIMPYINALTDKGITVSSASSDAAAVATLLQYLEGKTDAIFLSEASDAFDVMLVLNASVEQVLSIRKGNEVPHDETLIKELEPLISRLKEGSTSGQIVFQSSNDYSTLAAFLGPKTGLTVVSTDELAKRIMPTGSGGAGSFQAASSLIEQLWPKAEGLDLLSRGLRKKERTPLFLTGTIILAILFALIVYIYAPLSLEKQRSQEIDKQIASRRDEVKKVEALKKEIDALTAEIMTIDSFRSRRPLSLAIVREITSLMPNNAWLTRLRISDARVEIEGYAGSSATELIPKIEASKLFSRVELASAVTRDVKMNADRFVIKMEFEGMKKEELPGAQKR